MHFKIERKENENLHKYPSTDVLLAQKFADRLVEELGEFLMGVVVFGSTVRRESTEQSDIDVLIVTNDASFVIDEPLVEAYRVIVDQLILKTSEKFHVTSMTFTAFWEYARAGDPVVVNILRDGFALYDSGFFDPLQRLLKAGKIRPSEESIWRYFGRAPKTLTNSRWHLLQASLDLYWAVIDSAHAALMRYNQIPPTPEHVADLLQKVFVGKKLLDKKGVETMRKFYTLSKQITHRELQRISGAEYEKLYKEADYFVRQMKRLIDKGSY